MKREVKEVPRWVRDFISRQQQREETKWEPSNNTYLLHSFNDAQVKAIRAGVWKLREEAAIAYTKESGFDSGFSLNDPMFEPYLHKLLLTPMNRQEMQEVVAKYYGWDKWVDDPWGNSANFNDWVNDTKDNALAVWAVNETPGGRFYLAYNNLWGLAQLDYSQMSPEELVDYIGVGAENFLWVKAYTGWEGFQYPKEPLPLGFVNRKILKVSPEYPFQTYRFNIFTIYLRDVAEREMTNRIAEYPEVKGLLAYAIATNPDIRKATLALTPHYHPDKNKGWEQFEDAMRKPLKAVTWKYKDIFTLRSEVDEENVLEESYVVGQEGLLEAADCWIKKNFIVAGINGTLLPSLLRIVKNDLIDATRKINSKQGRDDTESQMDARREAQEQDVDTPFLDTIASPNVTPEKALEEAEETIDLKKLGFNRDELTPRELLLLDELSDATRKGHTKDSKEGLSLRQYWGEDYDRKMKMLKRLEAKLKKP